MSYSIDSRTIKPGDIFIPVKGPNFDGHDFIDQALANGAKEILDVDLVEFAKEKRKRLNIPIIAVTGSAGKTTVKDMLAAVLSQKFKVFKSKENHNNEIGVPLSLINIEDDCEIAIIEMAMRGLGQIEYLADIAKPTHAAITNVGYAHIELLHTRESIALAKSEVISKGIKVFLNKRDDYYDFLKNRAEEEDALVYDFDYQKITEANIAAVSTIAKEFGLSNEEIDKGLAGVDLSAHRLKTVSSKKFSNVTIIDDSYNSNPDALVYALNVLKEAANNNRKIAVVGDMKELGELGPKLHQEVDVSGIDIVVAFGELAQDIKNQYAFGIDEKERLIDKLQEIIKPGDYVLVKGSRSMAMEKIVENLI